MNAKFIKKSCILLRVNWLFESLSCLRYDKSLMYSDIEPFVYQMSASTVGQIWRKNFIASLLVSRQILNATVLQHCSIKYLRIRLRGIARLQ